MRCASGLPQQVWHHTSVFAAQPANLEIERLDIGLDRNLPFDIGGVVDAGLLDLDDRATRGGEPVILLIERLPTGP